MSRSQEKTPKLYQGSWFMTRGYVKEQKGIISLFVLLLGGLAVTLALLGHKELDFFLSQTLAIVEFLKTEPFILQSIICLFGLAFLVYIKDQWFLFLVKEKQRRLATIADIYNERFSEVQRMMMTHYSLFQPESVLAINEARALLGTVIQRLVNVGLFLGGSHRIHIYDAFEQVTKPLEFGENSISVVLVSEPFEKTKLSDLEDKLERLLTISEEPLQAIIEEEEAELDDVEASHSAA